MSNDSNDTVAPESGSTSSHSETNEKAGDTQHDLAHEVVMLRARCSNLRHWCRLMLEDPASTGILPEPTVTDLLGVTPEVSEPEGHNVIELLSRDGNLPPNHSLAPTTTDPVDLKAAISNYPQSGNDCDIHSFKLYDHLYPGDELSEEYLLEQISQGPGPSISELIAEFEREGANP